MNEIKINTNNTSIMGAVAVLALIAIVCAGIVYHYRNADGKLESELGNIERLNSEIASESRQLQAGIADHRDGIKAVRGKIGASRERVERVYTEIKQSAEVADRAIEVIADCQKIIETVKTQK